MLLSFSLKSQCLDTNTLLDSIYTIKFQDLIGIKKIIRSDKKIKGQQYHALIAHKIFINWNDTVLHRGADSIILPYKKHDYYINDAFIQVKSDSTTNYKIVIFDSRLDRFLITLSPTLQILDHICWYLDGRTTIYPKHKKTLTSGINTTLKDETINQEHYLESSIDGKDSSNTIIKRKRFIINNSGKFVMIN
jgi:hypothetical protein